ncbi:hypothetical protein D3C87_2082070 [compost metagenome]
MRLLKSIPKTPRSNWFRSKTPMTPLPATISLISATTTSKSKAMTTIPSSKLMKMTGMTT